MSLPPRSAAIAALCLAVAACAPAESRNATGADHRVIGIVQCDEYLARVDACIRERVPADQRAALTAEAHGMFTTWKEAAADPATRATLPQACGISHEVARDEFARYGCNL